MRLRRLRWPEWLITVGGVVLLVAMVALAWYGSDRRSLTGWDGVTHLRWVLLAAVILALGTAVLQAAKRAPAVPVTVTLFAALLGGVSVVVLIYRVLAEPPGGSRKAGGFVALVGALAIAYGGWRSLRTDGIAEADGPGEIPVITPSQTRPAAPGS
jgi:drug/metabolite transporter (DMT)-like permease